MSTLQPFRACSTLILRAVDEESRIIEGTASSARTDSYGDVLEPKGAVFELPMPLLMQHDRRDPIGQVVVAKVSPSDITIRATIAEEKAGLDYVEKAWKQIKAGLVKGLSIGAQPLKAEPILDKDGRMTGVRYTAWRWVELSAVTLPGNLDSTIDVVRSFDPWGAALFGARHDPPAEGNGGAGDTGHDPAAHTYEAIRARAIETLERNARALRRG